MGYENSGLVERIEQDIFVRGPYTQQQLQEIIEADGAFWETAPVCAEHMIFCLRAAEG